MSTDDTQPSIPIVGRCLVEPYAQTHWNLANEAIARLLASRDAAVVEIDIRPDGLRTAAAIESLIARVGMLVTTRLQGLVLALKNGVPVVAIDPMGDGGEMIRQASIIGWSIVFAANRLDEAELQRAFDHCLTAEARNEAIACADRARQTLSEIPGEAAVAIADPSVPPPAGGAEPTGRPSGSLTATPASLEVVALDSTSATTLEWSSEGTESVEVHVGAPDGPLLSRSGPSGKATTGQWVSDGLTFFLQDVTGGVPLTSDHTLAKIAVNVRSIESREGRPAVGNVQFGGMRRLTPISRQYGFDRGRPIDRYYIENFLARYASDVRGRTLEIGDDAYTRRFGSDRVTRRDVLHVSLDHPGATIVGDLASADHIASDVFDCVILTQTLHLVYDVRAALATVHRILRPGGVLLATFPGLTQIADPEWKRSWYWGLTTLSARRLIAETFPRADVHVESWGNVLAAIAFLHGLADQELRVDELDYQDPQYELLITLRAAKAVIA